MSQKSKCLLGLQSKYGQRTTKPGDIQQIVWQDNEHTPYNKAAGQVEATARFGITTCPEAGWVEFVAEETVYHASGRSTTRTISLSLNKRDADEIALHILNGKFKADNEPEPKEQSIWSTKL